MIRRMLVRLYPAAWRARYADEFLALLRACQLTPRLIVSVLRGALDAHLHFTTTTEAPMEAHQTRFVLRWVVWTLAGFGVAYAVLLASMAIVGSVGYRIVVLYEATISAHSWLVAALRLASVAAWLVLWPLLTLIFGAVQARGLPRAAVSARRWIIATGMGGLLYGSMLVAPVSKALPPEVTTVVFIAAIGLAQGTALARRADVLPWSTVIASACILSYAAAPLVGALGMHGGVADAVLVLVALLLFSACSGAALWRLHAQPVQHALT